MAPSVERRERCQRRLDAGCRLGRGLVALPDGRDERVVQSLLARLLELCLPELDLVAEVGDLLPGELEPVLRLRPALLECRQRGLVLESARARLLEFAVE